MTQVHVFRNNAFWFHLNTPPADDDVAVDKARNLAFAQLQPGQEALVCSTARPKLAFGIRKDTEGGRELFETSVIPEAARAHMAWETSHVR